MKKFIYGSMVVLAMIMYFLLRTENSSQVEDQVTIAQSAPKPLKLEEKEPQSLNQLAREKIVRKQKLVAEKDTSTHACHRIIDQFLEGPYEEILENPKTVYENLRGQGCRDALNPVLKKNPMLFDLLQRCLKNKTPECDSLMFFLKTWAVATKYPDNIDVAELDETILANKLMYNFSSNPALPVDVLDKNIEILDEMISKNPNLYGAQKAKLIHLFAKEFQFGLNVEEEFNSTFNALSSLKPDPDLDEIMLIRPFQKRNMDKREMSEHIDNFINKYPTNSKGPYYKAALEWNVSKNRENAVKWLIKAKSLDPKNQQVLNTLKKIKRAKTNDSIFYFSFHFDPQEV